MLTPAVLKLDSSNIQVDFSNIEVDFFNIEVDFSNNRHILSFWTVTTDKLSRVNN